MDTTKYLDDFTTIVSLALRTPRTARETARYLYGTALTGCDLWLVLGAIDRLVLRGQIVRCGHRDGRPVYVA